MRNDKSVYILINKIFPEFKEKNIEKILEFIQETLSLQDFKKSDMWDDDNVLLILENFHRVYDGLEAFIERNVSYPIYTGKGYRIY